jgi:integrating conjugative element protein (TIGR03756 family)
MKLTLNHSLRVASFCLLGFAAPPAAAFETVNTLSLSTGALAPACLRYRPVGACFYLVCSLIECHIETEIKVAHFNPDLVVSSYNALPGLDPVSGNPWVEVREILGGLQTGAASMLSGMLGGINGLIQTGGNFSHGKHQNTIYKEGDAIGHPLASVTGQMSSGLICPSDATSFKPYFMSGFDVLAWRWQVPELVYPQAWVPGWHEIGNFPFNTWGNLYPRSGMLVQSDEAKMAAVAAQRIGDIVTRKNQPHVYFALGEGEHPNNPHVNGNVLVWSPGALQENVADGGWWQLNAPVMEKRCHIFGESDLVALNSWGGGRVAGTGNYAFTLWRPYQCCKINGLFLGSVDFASNIPAPNQALSGTGSNFLGGLTDFGDGTSPLSLPSLPNLPTLSLP